MLTGSEPVCPRDGATPEDQELAPVPPSLDALYELAEPFALGDTGSVYMATQRESGYQGLLKIVPEGDLGGASERSRLKRELRKQTKLTNNSLVRIIDGGEVDRTLWLFRDRAPGDSLAARLASDGPVELDEALAITAQVATGLDELHRSGLLHRDVKPSHIILEPREDAVPLVRLIDAGLAARIETGSVFDLVGTPEYMSPEQAAGKLVSFRSDLYALGCVLHEMLSGSPPFTGDTESVLAAQKSQAPPPPGVELPAAVESLLAALLAKEPRKRPFSAQQVRRTLEPLLPASTPTPQSATRTSAGAVSAPAGAAAQARRGPPPPVPGVQAREDGTEEIELDEIAGDSEQPQDTMHLSADEVEALSVGDSLPPDQDAPQSTMRLSVEEVDALSVEDEPPPAPVEDAESARPMAEGDGVPPTHAVPEARDDGEVGAAIDDERAAVEAPEATDREALAAQEPPAPAGELAQPAEADVAAEPGRRAIDFDVESLFDDEVPAEPRGARPQDGVPTPLHRTDSGDSDPDVGKPTSIYQPPAPGEVAEDATVVVPRPPTKKSPLVPIAGAVAVIVLLWAVFSGGDEAPAVEEVAAKPSTAPAEEPGAVGAAEQAPAPAEATAEPAQAPMEAEAEASGEAAAEDEAAVQDEAASEEAQASAADDVAAEGEAAAAQGAAEEKPTTVPSDVGAKRQAHEVAATRAKAPPKRVTKPERPAAPARAKPVATGGPEDRKTKAAELKATARAHYRAGRYRDAAKAYEAATRQTPSDAGAYAGLGASALKLGDANGAIAAYQRAVRLSPRSSGFQAALGRAYYQKGDKGRARSAYQRALELDPNNKAASTALARLK